jgi:hypothetical protein
METFVILGRPPPLKLRRVELIIAAAIALAKAEAALCREGKRIHFVKIECFLHRMDALPPASVQPIAGTKHLRGGRPSRFALAEHDRIDSM